MHEELQFNPKQDSKGCTNFLDLTIIQRTPHVEFDIYRKPTTTDKTIHFKSIIPNERKLAAYKYYIEIMLNLPLNSERQEREWTIILHISHHNVFPLALI